MEKYVIHDVEYDNTIFHCVYEIATEQVIDFFIFKEDAIKRKNFLDNDGAFGGFTPEFVLKKVVVPEELDAKFERV